MARKLLNEPVFSLPPYSVEAVFTAKAETVDWGLTLLGIPQLWRITKGENIRIAVLDTGCAHLTHPDLRDAVEKARDFTGSQSGFTDVAGHGSHVCGVVAARENSSGVIGVAPQSKLLIAKVLDDNGSGKMAYIVKGIEWAISERVDIISMSLGSSQGHPKLEAACKKAYEAGIFIVAAAGNEGPSLDTVGYPARYETTVSVGSIDRRRKISRFSSRGRRVDVVAPGDGILSCYPPRGLAKLSGSSQATPFVAGVLALALAKHKKFGSPSDIKTRDAVVEHLKKYATDLGENGWDSSYGYGMINPATLLGDIQANIKSVEGITINLADLKPALRKQAQALFGPEASLVLSKAMGDSK